MDNNLFNATNCDCDVQIRKGDSYIEYFDTTKQLWVRLYPAFRLYRTSIDVMTFYANDGREITIKAGCSVSIDGTVYTDFNEIFDALTNIVNFFFSLSAVAFFGGLLADRPTNPILYQMYFATDLNTNGIPIWWNGTNWVNAAAAIIA